jgi:hypothetical protein
MGLERAPRLLYKETCLAKKTVYICDGPSCGAVLVNPEDGFVLAGILRTTALENDAKVLISSADTETSLCRECMAKVLGLNP